MKSAQEGLRELFDEILPGYGMNLRVKQKELALVEKNASDYNSILKNLGLPTVTTQEEFYQSKSDADKLKEDLASQKQELEDQVINIALEGKKFEADKLVVKDEIESLQKHRGSNLSIKYQRLREDLASSLNINVNHLAYIAELIEVILEKCGI